MIEEIEATLLGDGSVRVNDVLVIISGLADVGDGDHEPSEAAPRRRTPLVPGQLTSPDFVLGRRWPSTYNHVRLGPPPPSGLVWLATWPGTGPGTRPH